MGRAVKRRSRQSNPLIFLKGFKRSNASVNGITHLRAVCITASCMTAACATPAMAGPSAPARDLRAGPSIVRQVAVFKPDGRRLIARDYPELRDKIGLLVHSSTQSVCTAFCIAPDIVATAGHCVVGTASQPAGDPSGLRFRRDASNGPTIGIRGVPNGTANRNVISGARRLNTRPPINATSDWAFLRLEKNACPAGGLPLSRQSALEVAADAAAGRIYQIAYHRDLAHWKLAIGQPCTFVARKKAGYPQQLAQDFERPEDLLLHTCDTEAASSGSPLLVDGPNGPEVVGINVGTYVRSRVITHDGHIVQRLDSEVISNTALLAAPLIPRFEAFMDAQLLTAAHDIERLQELLAAHGLATGPIDGRFGPLTRRAIEDYEARVGLPISGLATQILLKRLETTTSASAAR